MRKYIATAAILAGMLPVAAFGAITLVVDKATLTQQGAQQEQIHVWGTLQMDATYATGGEGLAVAAVNTALTTAGYKGSCTTLERVYIANGEISDAPYFLAWDDDNAKVQAFKFTAGSAVTVATTGVASTPTALAVTTAIACTIDTTTCTVAGSPFIGVYAADIVGGTSDGKAAHVITGTPNAAQEISINPANGLLTINSGDATVVNVQMIRVSTAGTANVPTVVTGGTASTLAEVSAAADLSGLTVEFYAVCTQ